MRAITAGLTLGVLFFAAVFFGCGSKGGHDPSVDLINLQKQIDELRGLIAHVDAEFYEFKDATIARLARIEKRVERCGEDCCKR